MAHVTGEVDISWSQDSIRSIKVDFITKLDRVGLPIDWKFNNDSIHSSTLKEVSLNSQFLSSAYELKVNQRKGIRKEKGEGKKKQKEREKERKNKYINTPKAR